MLLPPHRVTGRDSGGPLVDFCLPSGQSVAMRASDLKSLWADYAVLRWTFEGLSPQARLSPANGDQALTALAAMVVRGARPPRIGFRDKAPENLLRDNLFAIHRHSNVPSPYLTTEGRQTLLDELKARRTPLPGRRG